ncbi:DUF2878 family protein [Klebsiella pneumoniae]|uniref:DUF2878 family protein n=1 Tax=Klebsiella pneumoniae TaxID=573 RepID=UPI0022AFF648|nr:DUF2878 family protein [Klebsiella pneumoniae]MCZ3395014.1 DUF2878 family protein [Klebsiella pneumoniae]
MTRPAQYLLMALAFDVYWTLVVMLRERGLLIWLTLALFAWLRLPAASRPPALLLAAAGCGLDACWALAAVGGPVAYLLGARLGAMTLLVPMALAVAAMACGWLVLMLLFHLGMGRRK